MYIFPQFQNIVHMWLWHKLHESQTNASQPREATPDAIYALLKGCIGSKSAGFLF